MVLLEFFEYIYPFHNVVSVIDMIKASSNQTLYFRPKLKVHVCVFLLIRLDTYNLKQTKVIIMYK